MADFTLQPWDLMARSEQQQAPSAPAPDETWQVRNGTAWVYYGSGNQGLLRPVILSDDFHQGASNLDGIWNALDNRGFAFASELRRRGRDLIILGYNDCTASMLDNAEVLIGCIFRAVAQRMGSSPLAVGGFGMGGLITRYALAKMEHQALDHQTAVYISYDSPHHGAWIPIGLQALAHALASSEPAMSKQVNSPAARQLLWRHIEKVDGTPREDPMRTAFLTELQRFGEWPMRPMKIGVANGTGKGSNSTLAGAQALRCGSGPLAGTTLYTQASGSGKVVAAFGGALGSAQTRTSDLPEADGAHGGMVEVFGLAADRLGTTGQVEYNHRWSCFVPTASAIAVDNPWDKLTNDVTGMTEVSALDDFQCASRNDEHALVTEELGSWILDRLPR